MNTKRKQDSQPISVQDFRDKPRILNDAELDHIAGGLEGFHFYAIINKSSP